MITDRDRPAFKVADLSLAEFGRRELRLAGTDVVTAPAPAKSYHRRVVLDKQHSPGGGGVALRLGQQGML